MSKNSFSKLAPPLQVFYHWAGAIPFEKSLLAQKKLKSLAKKSQFCFFGFESAKPVISLGLRADSSHILWPEEKLKRHNISPQKIKRGGEATLHSPGQLVIYPVLSLPALGLRVRDFILALENITKKLLEEMGIRAWREGQLAGLSTKSGKICFFGLHISEGLSGQGLSINVHNDLSLFQAIKSCGSSTRPHDKLAFYPHVSLSLKDLFFQWSDKAFGFFNQCKPLIKMNQSPF